MQNNEPESQSLSLQIWETAWEVRKEVFSILQGRISQPGGSGADEVLSPARQNLQQLMEREVNVAWKQHSGVWGSAVLAVVWSLPQLYLERGVLHSSESLDKYFDTPAGKCGIS